MRTRTLAIVTASILAPACAEPLPQRQAPQAVINGDLDTGDPAVVALMDGDYFFCSGTVVSPKVVLTAAHCLEGGAPTGIFFGTDANDPSSGTVIAVGSSLYHPEYGQTHDIGVIELMEATTVAPAARNTTALDAGMAGQEVRVVGFGTSVDNGDVAGVKRTGLTTFDSLEADYMFVSPRNNQSGCYGDSGGPNFMTIGGAEVLAGVTSFGTEDSCLAGLGGNTDVEKYNDWVDDFIAMVEGGPVGPTCQADGACVADCATPDPDCPVDPGPGPDPDPDPDPDPPSSGGCSTGGGQGSLLALGLLLMVVRRRRR